LATTIALGAGHVGAKVRHREKPIVRLVRIVFTQCCDEFEGEIRILWGKLIVLKNAGAVY
jgi:hypothetical protein